MQECIPGFARYVFTRTRAELTFMKHKWDTMLFGCLLHQLPIIVGIIPDPMIKMRRYKFYFWLLCQHVEQRHTVDPTRHCYNVYPWLYIHLHI